MTCSTCKKNFRPSPKLKELLKHSWLRLDKTLVTLKVEALCGKCTREQEKKGAIFWPSLEFTVK